MLESAIDGGTDWAGPLRKFLATYDQNELATASAKFQAECAQSHPNPGFFGRLRTARQTRAQQSAAKVFEAVLAEATVDCLQVEDTEAERQAGQAAKMFQRLGRNNEAQSLRLAMLNNRIRVGQSYRQAHPRSQEAIIARALKACRESARIAHRLGDPFCEAEYLTRLGHGLHTDERFRKAQSAFEKALGMWRQLASDNPALRYRVVRGLRHLGDACRMRLKYIKLEKSRKGTGIRNERAKQLFEEAVTLGEQLSTDRRELAFSLHGLGKLYQSERDDGRARECLSRCCDILDSLLQNGFTRMSEDPYSPTLESWRLRAGEDLASAMRGEAAARWFSRGRQ